MKDTLKRILGIAPTSAQAVTEKEVVDMKVDETSVPALAVAETGAADLASMTALFAGVSKELAAAELKITELTAAMSAQGEAIKAEAEAVKLTARKAKVEAAVGTEKAPALMSALATMSDSAFDAVMVAMATTVSLEAESALFMEVGIEAEADMKKVIDSAESNPTMDYLKSKYAPK